MFDPSSEEHPPLIRSRRLRLTIIGVVAAAALAGAAFVALNLFVVLGFWLNPPIEDEEEGVASAPIVFQASDVPGVWPLTVPSGDLTCHGDGIITFGPAAVYAVTAAARQRLGVPDVAEIAIRDAAGRAVDLEPFRRRARELCAGR